jgi:predicted membrane-bound spermidine synthase
MLGPKSQVGGPLRKGLKTQFLDDRTFSAMVHFPRDLERLPVDANRLTTAVVAEYYREGWSAFN